MELEFESRKLSCMEPITAAWQQSEQTQELRLPEGYPDIGRTLGAWGQTVLRSKQWNSDAMSVSGGVLAWVMYLPEDGSEMRCVEAWMPFSLTWNYPRQEREGTVVTTCFLSAMDARTLSARKMMVRANISAYGQALVPVEKQIPTPGQLPSGVELLVNRYPMTLIREAGEKNFLIDEELELTAGMADKLLRYSFLPVVEETKVMGQKLVFRGKGQLHVLCRNPEGELFAKDLEIPFSQFTELEQDYGPETRGKVFPVVTNLEPELTDNGRIHLKCGIAGQYTVMNEEMVTLAEDGYGLGRKVTLHPEQIQVPAVLDDRYEEVDAKGELPGDASVVDAAFYPEQPRLFRDGDGNTAGLEGVFQILSRDGEGRLQCSTAKWSLQQPLLRGEPGSLLAAPVRQTGIRGATAAVGLGLWQEVTEKQGMNVVSGITLGDPAPEDPARPSLVLQRMGEDTLWELAKSCGSTVELIRKANGLEAEPEPSRLLLIPVV